MAAVNKAAETQAQVDHRYGQSAPNLSMLPPVRVKHTNANWTISREWTRRKAHKSEGIGTASDRGAVPSLAMLCIAPSTNSTC